MCMNFMVRTGFSVQHTSTRAQHTHEHERDDHVSTKQQVAAAVAGDGRRREKPVSTQTPSVRHAHKHTRTRPTQTQSRARAGPLGMAEGGQWRKGRAKSAHSSGGRAPARWTHKGFLPVSAAHVRTRRRDGTREKESDTAKSARESRTVLHNWGTHTQGGPSVELFWLCLHASTIYYINMLTFSN